MYAADWQKSDKHPQNKNPAAKYSPTTPVPDAPPAAIVSKGGRPYPTPENPAS
jgi:hypothetical protein